MADGTQLPTGPQKPLTNHQRRLLMESALDRLLSAVDGVLADLDALDGDPDLEDGDPPEPSLGAPEAAQFLMVTGRDRAGYATGTKLSDPVDQTRWASTAFGEADLEVQCEDEGAQCEGEGDHDEREPDLYHLVPHYADNGQDQTRLAGVFAGVEVSPLGVR